MGLRDEVLDRVPEEMRAAMGALLDEVQRVTMTGVDEAQLDERGQLAALADVVDKTYGRIVAAHGKDWQGLDALVYMWHRVRLEWERLVFEEMIAGQDFEPPDAS